MKVNDSCGVTIFPCIFINGVMLQDAVSPFSACQAICAALGTEVEACQQCMPKTTMSILSPMFESTVVMSTAALTAENNNQPNESFYKTLLVVIVGVMAVAAVALWVKSRLHIEAMQGQV